MACCLIQLLTDLTNRTIHDHLSMEIDPALHPFLCQQRKKELNPGRDVAFLYFAFKLSLPVGRRGHGAAPVPDSLVTERTVD